MSGLQQFPADDIQTWLKEDIFLGCHAQWITPESVGERLPYYDHEKQLAITADAIIDNRNELFEKLRVDQKLKKKISDSELILLAYQKWGEEVSQYLIGDFAFMIWDERKRVLFGARDFSGNRTLYFNRSHQYFAFCTVIQPLLKLPCVEKKLNEGWLAEFIAIPDMIDSVDASSTVYKNIEQLPPSHTISVTNGTVSISRYCTITAGEQLQLKSNQEYIEAFRDVFQNAVNVRLRTHRQVGSYLSGGLDSGSVVGFAAKALRKDNKSLHTFSYIPPKDFTDWTPKWRVADESSYIKEIVKYVGNISDKYLDFEGKSPLTEVDDCLTLMEMPYKFFENSFWLKGIFEKAHLEGMGVLLNGARGNYTISWGSALEFYALLLRKLRWIRLYLEINKYCQYNGVKRTKMISVVSKTAFPNISQILSSEEKYIFPTFINPDFAKRTKVYERLKGHGIDVTGSQMPDVFRERIEHFERVFPWNATGTWGAKLSLRHSLWQRDPTNDINVIQFCLRVPEEQYVNNGLDRALIRRSTENYLPDKVRLNNRIRGIQGADWIHRTIPAWNSFMEELEHLCKNSVIAGFLNIQVIKDAICMIRQEPRPEYAFKPEYRMLMRSLIVYRFIKNLA